MQNQKACAERDSNMPYLFLYPSKEASTLGAGFEEARWKGTQRQHSPVCIHILFDLTDQVAVQLRSDTLQSSKPLLVNACPNRMNCHRC